MTLKLILLAKKMKKVKTKAHSRATSYLEENIDNLDKEINKDD